MSKKKKTATEDLNIEEKIVKIKKAEEEWKEKKSLELKKHQRLKRRLLKKQEQEMQKKSQKQEEAEKHFIQWKESWSEKQKNKISQVVMCSGSKSRVSVGFGYHFSGSGRI